jgi:hypothetical protein
MHLRKNAPGIKRSNCKNSPLWNSNCENGSLFRTLQKRSTFFEMKERAGPIPLRVVNGVKYYVRKHVCPLQKGSYLYEYFAK